MSGGGLLTSSAFQFSNRAADPRLFMIRCSITVSMIFLSRAPSEVPIPMPKARSSLKQLFMDEEA